MKSRIQNVHWSTVLVCILMLFVMIGGCMVIMDKPCWTLDDDTWIQRRIGIGEPMLMNEAPVFSPDEGRFFPTAYQHNNILLLFQTGSISAKTVFYLNAIGWCLLIISVYWIVRKTLQEKVSVPWVNLIASVVIVVLAQRSLHMFTVLWTTLYIDILLASIICISLYYWSSKRKVGALIVLMLSAWYYAFALEVNVATPLIIGLCAMLPIQKKKMDLPLGLIMIAIVILYIVLYMTIIYPHIQTAYDSTHGTGVSLLSNAKSMLFGQKLLILIGGVFIWRLYKVFIRKEAFDAYSDTLLSVSVGGIIAGFVMKLNWPEYYIPTLVFAVPSMVSLLDFQKKRSIWASCAILLLILLYFGVKIPKEVKHIHNERANSYQAIAFFDGNCLETPAIAWYEDPNSENPTTDKWAYSHICQHLSQVFMQKEFHPEQFEHIKEDVFILMTPDNVSKDTIIENGIVQPECIMWDKYMMSIHIFKINKHH